MRITRRQFIGTGVAAGVLATLPAPVSAAPATVAATVAAPVALVHPATNVLHLGARFGRLYGFEREDIHRILGTEDLLQLSEQLPELPGGRSHRDFVYRDEFTEWIGISIDAARDRAEAGENEIYQRCQSLLNIRHRLNNHHSFSQLKVEAWLRTPNPHLNGAKFRDLMVKDIHHAESVLDLALYGPQAVEHQPDMELASV